ncbi:hypothetical protein [Gloeothece verrucosa]|uniref:Uncharacterized protein n=1 Tax=Gloeothece verrucosa (strain PCC 7822) TaxID=497965 RepID=E0UCB1_GLOV7|nr:hypothetical protein [Gloeothece verrucosa]ADN12868.1 hypothetical protein Cyan7822_0848 [Gloeothece verrucosa PCC 7822]
MDTPLYDKANRNTRKAMARYKKKWGHINWYRPRPQMLQRWMEELGWTEEQVLEQLSKERRYLIKELYGIDAPF